MILDLGKIRSNFKGGWSIATQYEYNDVVRYGAHTWIFIGPSPFTATLATQNPQADTANWTIQLRGFNNRGVWSATTTYLIGEVVKYGARLYQALATSTGAPPPNANWSLVLEGLQYEGYYSSIIQYQMSDVVSYGGNLYISTADTLGNLPVDNTKWSVFLSGLSNQGVWLANTPYAPNQFVTYNNVVYLCIAPVNSAIPPIADNTDWQVLISSNGYGGSSSTSNAIATGSKTFVVGPGLAYLVGSRVHVQSAANYANFMEGPITAYSAGSITIAVDSIGGTGTFTDWQFTLPTGSNGLNGTNGAGYKATSATSLAIATGSQAFNIGAGFAYVPGNRARAVSQANSANYMEGAVLSYVGAVLTLSIDHIGGSGTFADWNITERGEPAPARILGTATLVAGTVSVANTSVVAGSKVFHSRASLSGTPGFAYVTLAPGTGFTIISGNGADTSTFNWELII